MTTTRLTAPQVAALRAIALRDYSVRRNVLAGLVRKGLATATLVAETNYRSKRTHYRVGRIELTEAGRTALTAL